MSSHIVAGFLGWFSEVRELRRRETQSHNDFRTWKELLDAEKQAHSKVLSELAYTKDALATMTEARLNSDSHADSLARSIDVLKSSHEAAIVTLKQTVDCFSLAACGRQVFGTAPSLTTTMSPESQTGVAPVIQGRKMVQEQTRLNYIEAETQAEDLRKRAFEFIAEAQARHEAARTGTAPEGPLSGTEYSSTAKAI